MLVALILLHLLIYKSDINQWRCLNASQIFRRLTIVVVTSLFISALLLAPKSFAIQEERISSLEVQLEQLKDRVAKLESAVATGTLTEKQT